MLAHDIMTPCTVVCTQHTSLRDAAHLMIENHCGFLPVVQDNDPAGTIIGVVTERDLVCRVVAEGLDPVMSTVWLAMSMPAQIVHDDATVDECILRLRHHYTDHLVVVDHHGEYCGLIAQGDVGRQRAPASAVALLTVDDVEAAEAEPAEQWLGRRAPLGSRTDSGRLVTAS